MTPGDAAREAAERRRELAALRHRAVIAGAFVVGWIVLGSLGHMSPNAYLLAGVPLTILFQRLVHGQPLWRAWVRTGPRPPLDGWGWACAVALALLPCLALIQQHPWPAAQGPLPRDLEVQAWLLAAGVGGVVAGHVLRGQSAAAWRRCAPYTAMAVLCGGIIFTVAGWQGGHLGRLAPGAGGAGPLLGATVMYFDVAFVVEEVAFRGVLDPYLLGGARSQAAQYASALAGSALWGLWHLPLLGGPDSVDIVTVLRVVLTHASFGLVLCFAVRAAGTLVPGALAHALSDAYRNLLS